jgi:hypothetical protein
MKVLKTPNTIKRTNYTTIILISKLHFMESFYEHAYGYKIRPVLATFKPIADTFCKSVEAH